MTNHAPLSHSSLTGVNSKTQTAPTPRSLEELRVRMAELCGFQLYSDSNYDFEVWHDAKGDVIERLPNWPSDLNSALKLIDLLADKGWTCQLDNGLDKTWECTFEIGTSGRKDFRQRYASADTLSEAICRAFVALHEGMK